MSSNPLSSRSRSGRFYHPELDALRGFAFLLIFIHHSFPHDPAFYTRMGTAPVLASMLAALGATGAFGVHLFFLLSSYLVTELLIRERTQRGHVDLKAFYIRRILRVWPLYFAFLALAWAMQWFVPGQLIGWRAGLAFMLFVGNWWVVFVGFPSSVIFPLWFISIQEQFYLFWPAAMRKLSERGLLTAAVLLIAVANLTRWYLASRQTWESRIWANTFVHLDSIALGIVIAVLLAGRAPRLAPIVRAALLIGGFTCFVLAGNYFRIKFDPLTTPRVLLGYPMAAIGAVALLLGTLCEESSDSSRRRVAQSWFSSNSGVLSSPTGGPHPPAFGECGNVQFLRMWSLRPLILLGRISYGLYVFHVLGLMISDYTVHNHESSLSRYFLRDVVAFSIAVVLAAISYRWFETPFLSLKQRFTRVLSRPGD